MVQKGAPMRAVSL